jgi:hypothetical protein
MRPTKRTILAGFSLLLVLCFSQTQAEEDDLTRSELLDLLKARDAAIIQLQHSLNDLVMRIETVERSIDPVASQLSPEPQLTAGVTTPTVQTAGFGKLEIDEQAAQRALERTLIQGGALLLPAWRTQFAPSLAYSLNQADFPVVVADGDEQLLGSNEAERNTILANLDMRIGLPFESQLELGIPYTWVDEELKTSIQGISIGQNSRQSGQGLGSLQIGLAKTFIRESGWRPDIVGRVTWDTGSGDRTDNNVFIGGGFKSLSGSLNFTKRSDPLVFFGSVNYRTFYEDDGIEPGDQFTLSFGTALAVSPTASLFATLTNQFIDDTKFGNQQIGGNDVTAISLGLGASAVVSRGVLFNLTTGIGLSENAPDYSIVLSASIQTDALRKVFYK